MDRRDLLYRLVIFDQLQDPRPVRDLFAKVLGVHPTDAAQWVARVPGVWPKLLGEADVRALLDGLYSLEVAAEARRADAFPEVHRPRTIHAAACLDAGLRIDGLRGEPAHWVPWDRVELVAGGYVASADEARDVSAPGWIGAVSTGFRAATGRAGRRGRTIRFQRDPIREVIIVRRDPILPFRVVENQMNYGYLGDQLRPSSAENFSTFLADLVGRAGKAIVTDSTLELLGRKPDGAGEDDPADADEAEPARPVVFGSTQALADDALLELLWGWYRRDRDALEGTGEHRQIP